MKPRKDQQIAAPAAAPAGTYRYENLLQADFRRQQAMVDDRAVSARDVRETILPDLDRPDGQAGTWTVHDQVIKGRESWIFRAEAPHVPFPLAVKVYCSAVKPEDIVRQHGDLRRYREAMAGRPELTVPVPWAALPDHRTLVMEWVDEPRLDRQLQQAGSRREERARLMAVAGRWLRHFHESSGVAVRPFASDRPQRRIDLLLGGQRGAGQHVRDRAFRRAYAVLAVCAEEFAGTPLTHALAHGDFLARNLLHGDRGTIGIDIGGRPNSPVTDDIFRFLVQAEVERPLWSRASAGVGGPDARAFLAAYGVDDQLRDERLITYLYLASTVARWALRINRFGRGRYSFHRILHWLRLRQMAMSAVSALETTRRQ